MILHDFRCQDCGSLFEELLRSSQETSNVTCPQCQSKQVKQLLSAVKGRVAGSDDSAPAGLSGCSPAAGFS
ncbi:MAG: FmdB family zinc ribbon protein [Desulfohalobiaceae bacterium]